MSASKANLHERLREATRALHDELEHVVGVSERIATRDSYTDYLSKLWTLYTAAENALHVLDFVPCGFDYPAPYRSRLLEADLELSRCYSGAASTTATAVSATTRGHRSWPWLRLCAGRLCQGRPCDPSGDYRGARPRCDPAAPRSSAVLVSRPGVCGRRALPPSTVSTHIRGRPTARSRLRSRHSKCSFTRLRPGRHLASE